MSPGGNLSKGLGGRVGLSRLRGVQVEGLELRGALLPDGQQGAAGTARPVRKAALKLKSFAGM